MTAFILRPMRTRFSGDTDLQDTIRISFKQRKTRQHELQKSMRMSIGKRIARQFGFQKGDKVIISVSEENPYIWDLIKEEKGSGWKLTELGNTLILDIAWKHDFIKTWDTEPKFVSTSLVEGKLRLRLPGYKEYEDQEEAGA